MDQRQQDRHGVVVIGSDFRALGIVHSLGRHGIPVIIIDRVYRAAWFSRYVVKRYKWQGFMDDKLFLNFLLQLGKKQHLEQWILIPTTDDAVELIARHTLDLSKIYRLVTQPWEIVRWANDKRLTYSMAQKLDVPYPKTWYPANEDDLLTMDITFPSIVKPALSVRFHRATLLKALPVNNKAELLTQYRLAARTINPAEIMIQELIPGDGRAQYSVGAFSKEGKILLGMSARRTRQYPIDYGLNSSFVEAIKVPVLFELAERLLCHMRVSGMIEIEFKYDHRDGQYKLLDINVRPWGWHKLCMACGLDFPYIQYCDMLGQTPAHIAPLYDYHWVRLLTDIPAGLQEIQAGLTTPGHYLRSFSGNTVFSVFDWYDPLPVFGDLAAIAISKLMRRTYRKR